VLELASVGGDVPALCRLVVTDAATQSRRWVVWGLESRFYSAASPPALIIDSPTMMETSGYAGTTATRSGAYSGATNNIISATLQPQPQAVCGLGNLSHVGAFRPHLRFYASATTIAVRLTFQALDGPMRSLGYRVPVAAGWNLIDMGLLSVPESALGTQRWTGRIEAYSTASGGEVIDIDVLLLAPAELFGRARPSYSDAPGVLVARDDFTGTTAGGGLNGRAAPAGGSWVTSGATTDFTFSDSPERITRATTADGGSGRIAVLGSTDYTDTRVGVDVSVPSPTATLGDSVQQSVGARHVDDSNFAELRLLSTDIGVVTYDQVLEMSIVIAGTRTVVASSPVVASEVRLQLDIRATGVFTAEAFNASGGRLAVLSGVRSELATGGVLATGKPRIRDFAPQSSATPRYYDNIYIVTPPAEQVPLHSGQSIEFRHDSALREDSTGTYAGPPPEYVGSRFFAPPAGDKGRKTRVAVMARRNDVAVANDDHIADSTTVEAFVTPRYLAVPR
jgi:hypothetical protein